MQIAIVVDDKLVLVNSKPLELSELDWSVFDMDPVSRRAATGPFTQPDAGLQGI